MSTRIEFDPYWKRAFPGRKELKAYLEKKNVSVEELAGEGDSDEEEHEQRGVLELLALGIREKAFNAEEHDDVKLVEATATKLAGSPYTVPCRLASAAPFPTLCAALQEMVHQAGRLRFSAYEFIHLVLIEEMGPAGTADTSGRFRKFDFQPNWVGELLLGSKAAIKMIEDRMPSLGELIKPWDLSNLDTCRRSVRDAHAFYKENLRPLEEPQPIPHSSLNNVLSRHKTRFVAECAVESSGWMS